MLVKKLEQVIRENALISAGDRVVVAVSGGIDSMALLRLLSQLSPTFPLSLVVAHLDHQLRPESSDDAEFVAVACRQLNVPCVVAVVDVENLARTKGVGLEEAGRDARKNFLLQVADDNHCSAIVLGHHADDQAETLLFRLLRGCGLTGLASMRMVNGPFVRPLLGFRHAELKEYLQQNEIAWCEDASNENTAFTRNRIRHTLLPQLSEYNPRLVEALNRLSHQAADEDDYWDTAASAFLDKHGTVTNDGFEVEVDALLKISRAERRRFLRTFLSQLPGHLFGVDAGHVSQVENLLFSERPQADLYLPGIWVARRYKRLVCAPMPPEIPEYEIRIDGPGDYLLPTGDRLEVSTVTDVEINDRAVFFAAEQIPYPLIVRSPRPGDRFRPSGMAGRKLLKDFFVDEKVERESRHRTPVICCGEEIIWLAGHRRCEGFNPDPGSPLLKIVLFR